MKTPKCDGGCGREALFAYIPRDRATTPLWLCLVHTPDERRPYFWPGEFYVLVSSSRNQRRL